MSGLFQKVKVLYGKLKVTRGSYARDGVKIVRDWKIFLTLTFFSLLVVAIFAFYFYTQIAEGKLFVLDKNNTKKEVKIDLTLLKKVVGDISLREVSLLEVKQNKSIPSDPSL